MPSDNSFFSRPIREGALKRLFRRRAKKAAREGIDILDAAKSNLDHEHLPQSKPQHARYIFAAAGAMVLAGMALPVATAGHIALLGFPLMTAGKFTAYRGLRSIWPLDRANPTRFGDNPLRAAVDMYESISGNQHHFMLSAAPRENGWSLIRTGASAVVLGLAIGALTVGPPAIAGLLCYAFGTMALQRGYRALYPYRGGRNDNRPDTPASASPLAFFMR